MRWRISKLMILSVGFILGGSAPLSMIVPALATQAATTTPTSASSSSTDDTAVSKVAATNVMAVSADTTSTTDDSSSSGNTTSSVSSSSSSRVRLTMARVVLAQPVVRQQTIQRVRRVSYRLRERWERYRGPSIVMAY